MPSIDQDHSAILDVVRAYVEGMTFADEARLRAAFHPDAFIVGNYEGKLERLSLEQFIAAIHDAGVPQHAEAQWTIVSTTTVGDAAMVIVEDSWLGMRFTDFLSLLAVDAQWVIVHKLYHLHPAPKA